MFINLARSKLGIASLCQLHVSESVLYNYLSISLCRSQWSSFKRESEEDSYIGADGLVGYDTALTRQGSRVQFPLRVVVFVIRLGL